MSILHVPSHLVISFSLSSSSSVIFDLASIFLVKFELPSMVSMFVLLSSDQLLHGESCRVLSRASLVGYAQYNLVASCAGLIIFIQFFKNLALFFNSRTSSTIPLNKVYYPMLRTLAGATIGTPYMH